MAREDLAHLVVDLDAVLRRRLAADADAFERVEERAAQLGGEELGALRRVAGERRLEPLDVPAADAVQELALVLRDGYGRRVSGVHGAVFGGYGEVRALVHERQHHDREEREREVDHDLSPSRLHSPRFLM